jgi:hypothetical protein
MQSHYDWPPGRLQAEGRAARHTSRQPTKVAALEQRATALKQSLTRIEGKIDRLSDSLERDKRRGKTW